MGIETTIIPLVRQVIYTTYAAFPTTGLTNGDLAWATDRLCLYRWNGSGWTSIGISSRHGAYASRGTASEYPESSLYQADDTGALYMVVSGAWVFIATSSLLFSSEAVVTGSRAFTTVYRNTTGKTMLVHVAGTISNTYDLTAYSDSNASPTTIVAYGAGPASRIGGVTFMVLNNNYYKVIGGGSPTLSIWTEWS